MKHKQYDHSLFKQAVAMIENDPYEAKRKFEQYIEQYPEDYATYPFYISVLITLRELDKASYLLNQIKTRKIKFRKSDNKEKELKLFEEHLLTTEMKLLSYQEKYDELYYLCINNQQKLKDYNINHLIFYSRKKHGLLENFERKKHYYLFRQTIEYQEEDFLNHIKKHLADYNQDIDNPNKAVFASNFPIEKILAEIKKYIPSDKSLYYNFHDNKYIFKYNNCGKVNNIGTDYFTVMCFHNTPDIITMYPSTNNYRLPHIDLNYLIEEKETPKVKRLSQIDKFNQRYNRK